MSFFNMKPSRKWSELVSLPLLCSIVLSVVALRGCAADDEGQVGEGPQLVGFPHNNYYDSYIQPHRAEALIQTAKQRRQVDTETLAGLGYENENPTFRRSPSALYSTPPNVYAERQSHQFSALKSESAPSFVSSDRPASETRIDGNAPVTDPFKKQTPGRQEKLVAALNALKRPERPSKEPAAKRQVLGKIAKQVNTFESLSNNDTTSQRPLDNTEASHRQTNPTGIPAGTLETTKKQLLAHRNNNTTPQRSLDKNTPVHHTGSDVENPSIVHQMRQKFEK